MEKTNMEYLKDLIKGNEEAFEFWEAVDREIKDIKEELDYTKRRIGALNQINTDIEGDLKILQAALESDADLEKIDCGIGVILYRANNLQLQALMEDFKEKHQVHF